MRINLLLGILFFVADGVFAVPDASLVKRVLIGGDAATLRPLAPERPVPMAKGLFAKAICTCATTVLTAGCSEVSYGRLN